jgi:hypothetical protein
MAAAVAAQIRSKAAEARQEETKEPRGQEEVSGKPIGLSII